MKDQPKIVALFGGAFNPPHLAHRQVLEALVADKLFGEIWVLPSYSHPFEKKLAGFEDRVALCELMIEGLPKFVSVSRVEAELKSRPSFTVDVVSLLKIKYPDTEFFIVIGSDCKADLTTWKEIDVLKAKAHFYYVPRPGHEASPFLDVSSTLVREKLARHEDIDGLVLPSVVGYIQEKGLYRD